MAQERDNALKDQFIMVSLPQARDRATPVDWSAFA